MQAQPPGHPPASVGTQAARPEHAHRVCGRYDAGYGHAAVLWSRATARDIVDAIAADAQAGRLAPAEAVELIDRVWDRAVRP